MCWKLAILLDFSRKYECSALLKNDAMSKRLICVELEADLLEIISSEYGTDRADSFAALCLGWEAAFAAVSAHIVVLAGDVHSSDKMDVGL